jgi:hypothetical protein
MRKWLIVAGVLIVVSLLAIYQFAPSGNLGFLPSYARLKFKHGQSVTWAWPEAARTEQYCWQGDWEAVKSAMVSSLEKDGFQVITSSSTTLEMAKPRSAGPPPASKSAPFPIHPQNPSLNNVAYASLLRDVKVAADTEDSPYFYNRAGWLFFELITEEPPRKGLLARLKSWLGLG